MRFGMDVLDVIGDFGKYQKEIFAVLLFRSLVCSFTFYLVHLSSPDVGHWCKPPDEFSNLTRTEWKECCLPKNQKGYGQCQRYDGAHLDGLDNTTLVDCTEWDYEKDKHISLKSEWDLVCNRKWLLSQVYAAFFFGNLVSYPIAGYVADRLGRRKTILLGCAGLLITNTALYFVTSLTWFLIARILTGLPYVFLQSVSITYFLEITGKKQRPRTALFTSGSWGFFSIVFLGLSMLNNSWKTLVLISSFPVTLPYFAVCWRFLPESPRWLVAKGQLEKAREVLNMATKKNGIKIQDMDSVIKCLRSKIQQGNESQEKSELAIFFKKKKLLCITFILVTANLLNTFSSTGYFIVLRNLGGNFHVNFVVTQCLVMLNALFSSYILSFITRRRRVLIFVSSVSGILYFFTTALDKDTQWLRTALGVTARTLNSLLAHTQTLFLSEFFPTQLRARGFGLCRTAGRVGVLCASYIDLLSQEHGRNAPFFLIGGINLFIGFLFIFVPDVANQNLPDSVAETEKNMNIRAREEPTSSKQDHDMPVTSV